MNLPSQDIENRHVNGGTSRGNKLLGIVQMSKSNKSAVGKNENDDEEYTSPLLLKGPHKRETHKVNKIIDLYPRCTYSLYIQADFALIIL